MNYEEMIQTETGRGQLQDALHGRMSQVSPKVVNEEMDIPTARVVSCADHRSDGGCALEKMRAGQWKPIEVGEVWIGNQVYYVPTEGNHRAEAARTLGVESIRAKVLTRTWLQEKSVNVQQEPGLER